MFMSGSNIGEATDLKNVIATGKRSLVVRLVCGPLLVIVEPHSLKMYPSEKFKFW